MVPLVWLQPITGAFTGQFEDKRDGDALTARRPVHMPRMKMRELGLLLVELKAYREAAATVSH